ncbi:MAG: sigma 54-interacting transcriptional regulator [Bacillota bacterium]
MSRQSPETPVEASIRSAVASADSLAPQPSTDALYYSTGHRIGQKLGVYRLEEIAGRLNELGMGRVELVDGSPRPIVFHWFDCLTCSGLPNVGRPLCYLEAGILAGAVQRACGRPVSVQETRCWGLGDTFCEMRVHPEEQTHPDALPVLLSEDELLVTVTLRAVQTAKLSRLRTQESIASSAGSGHPPAGDRPLPAISVPSPAGERWLPPQTVDPQGGRPELLGDAIFAEMPIPLALVDDRGLVVKANSAWHELGQCWHPGAGTFLAPPERIHRVLQTGQAEVWVPGRPSTCDFVLMALPLERDDRRVGVLLQAFGVDSELTRLLVLRVSELESEARRYRLTLERSAAGYARFGPLETANPRMRDVLLLAQRVAQTGATVLITGESGTGKEVLARAIHAASPRAAGPFVKVDCTAVPEQLVESELFGYEEGAFTGARRGGKPGKLELAHGGTLFLDEIGDLPLGVQAKLLRVVESREFERLGGTRTLRLNARIVAATNRDLHAMVRMGSFRADLLYRLEVVQIALPPLRERLEDLPLLVEALLARLNHTYGKQLTLAPGCLDLLRRYSWPGNVRELENALERAAIVCRGDQITPPDLPGDMVKWGPTPAEAGETGPASPAPVGVCWPEQACDHWQAVAETERQVILRALGACGGNKSAAARMLGISRQALHAKMNRLGLAAARHRR